MDHASWIPRATFFEIAVYLKTCWHNDIIAYVGNVNIDLNIQAKDQFFPYVVMLMPLCYYHVRMFTNEAWRHNLLCNILFTGGPITGELISRMTYISGIYFAHLFCAPKFLNDRWEQCVLLVVPKTLGKQSRATLKYGKILKLWFLDKLWEWQLELQSTLS